MSARKGYLPPPAYYTTKMSCPNNQAGNSFFVDSLINARSDSGSYYQTNGVYLPPAADYSYGLSGGSCFPGIGKRNEPSTQSVIPSAAPYAQGMETWLETSRSCRVEPPGGPHIAQCSFSPSIKEESAYCLYESDKCPKGATVDDISYSAASCPVTGSTVPVPGYFRLSQTYTSSRLYHDVQPNMSHFTLQRRLDTQPSQPPSVSAEPETRESHEEAPVPAPCVPAREEDSRLSSDGSSSPEPAETCGAECPEKTIKGEGR